MSETCKQCGSVLAQDKTCPVCLLRLVATAPDSYDGEVWNLPTIEGLNAQFPHLKVDRLVGRGGMGAIFHARQTSLDREVALKIIAREISDDSLFLDRFEREAKALAKLSHPNIVTVYDFGHTHGGLAYLVMEYVDGINLRQAMGQHPMSFDDSLDIVSSILHGLEYAHRKGVIHRDIKPENILLGQDGTLKVADFGIAKIVDNTAKMPTLTGTQQILGSMHYMAPEHLESPQSVNERIDIYAVGVLLYELLTGQLPLGRFDPPSHVNPECPVALDDIVLRALARKPEDRFQAASEMQAEIEVLLSEKRSDVPLRTHARRLASVPFVCEYKHGFSEAVGMVSTENRTLSIEYRVRDTVWGAFKSSTHTLVIPAEKITRFELLPGMFAWRLVLAADKIATLGDLPNAELGTVELKVKRADVKQAKQVVQDLGFDTRGVEHAVHVESESEKYDPQRRILGILLIVCAVMNAGYLAVVETIGGFQLSGMSLAVYAIAAAVTLGPIFVVQLIVGILNLATRPKAPNIAVAILGLIPLSPVWLITAPTAIWSLRWLIYPRVGAARASNDSAMAGRQGNWGTTTLLFVRENRWARFVAVANVVGLAFLAVGFATYGTGYYPTHSRFRIVHDTPIAVEDLVRAVEARMVGLNASLSQSEDLRRETLDPDNTNTFVVESWAKDRLTIRDRLALRGDIQWVWLPAREVELDVNTDTLVDPGSEIDSTNYPIRSGFQHSRLAISRSNLGEQIQGTKQTIDVLMGDLLAVASELSENKLSIKLSRNARQRLNDSMPNELQEPPQLGLLINGVVHGIAPLSDIDHDQIQLEVSRAVDVLAIQSALRGPALPCFLEPVD
ncbi:MAG: serine/threonine protein kinase [Planctomycetales bacterium]|nr:serine/threonine protein kinase [Planctomycetales bacterium]